jgi:serine/threonine protein phosphatase PrpC
VGTFSNHGIEHDYEYNVVVKINQDRGSVDYPFVGGSKSALFSVMDGHGKYGDKVSDYCILSLHDHLYAHEEELMADPGGTMTKAYVAVDKSLERLDSIDSVHSGTSAVTVYMLNGKLWIANCGDSRAVLSGKKVVDLSHDQNPDTPGEAERIIQAKGVGP